MPPVRYPDYDPGWEPLHFVRVMANWPPVEVYNLWHRDLNNVPDFKGLSLAARHVVLMCAELFSLNAPFTTVESIVSMIPHDDENCRVAIDDAVKRGFLTKTEEEGLIGLGKALEGYVRIVREHRYVEITHPDDREGHPEYRAEPSGSDGES